MLKVYVAGGSSERAGCSMWIARLRERGIEITHDWTACGGYGRPSSVAERLTWAHQDLEAVRRADLVWVLMPDKMSEGATGEMVGALILKKTVFVSGPHALRESRIFSLLARHFPAHDDALREICSMSNEK